MTRTFLFNNDNLERLFHKNFYVLCTTDIITNEYIYFRVSYDIAYELPKNNDNIILTGKPGKIINLGTRANPEMQLIYDTIKPAGITRRLEVQNKFPEYFI